MAIVDLNHAPHSHRDRLELHRILVKQFDAGIGVGRVADFDGRDHPLIAGGCGIRHRCFVRNSDRR
jgi:hypothetical protein